MFPAELVPDSGIIKLMLVSSFIRLKRFLVCIGLLGEASVEPAVTVSLRALLIVEPSVSDPEISPSFKDVPDIP